ncbi:Caskin-1 [Chionoecetes opilio]|uniref:Caskin-1 n=1 Tax=Chionoecetes opilio TaxID=41210 RepID=A0A8J4XTK6_CHIOP|nr:Caskin-1 [Chionoecetes opilio]
MKCEEQSSLKEAERRSEEGKRGEGKRGTDDERTPNHQKEPEKPTNAIEKVCGHQATLKEPDFEEHKNTELQRQTSTNDTRTSTTSKEGKLSEACEEEEESRGNREGEEKKIDDLKESSGKTERLQKVYWGVSRGRETTTTTSKEGKLSEACEEEEKSRGNREGEEKKIDDINESKGKSEGLQNVYWGVTRGQDLPPSVCACFEVSPSLLARVQGRLLSLLGRANRYHVPPSHPTPLGMPLEVLRRKVKEARHKLFHHSRPASSKCSQKAKSSASESSSVSESPTPLIPIRGSGNCRRVEEPCQKYWGGEDSGGTAGAEEEIELLQQYLNLQHLARSRKHSAQLRRIRDSLLLQVRSRPNSLVTAYDPALVPVPAHARTPARPAQAPKNDMQQLRDFLLDIGFVQDYSILNRHGYDLATAAHMDALDLAGAGVTEPLHRMALKHELNLMQQPPQVPEEVPETVEQWLEGLGLTDYVENFHLNGIYCPLAALNLNKRDLQLMGVYMQGHRKKILLSLTALKESLFRRQ